MATIAGIATGSDDFSILVSALTYLDQEIDGSALVATLSDASQDLTVFAPTNAAFGRLAADLGFDGDVTDADAVTTFIVDNVPAETLNAVVTYHVSPGAQTAAAITAADSIATLQGATIGTGALPALVDNEPDLLNPSLTTTDVAADNGVVHIIDRVLLPVDLPGNDTDTILGIVAASGDGFDATNTDFDMLQAAVVAADLGGALSADDADLTVFAPNDAAFIGLATLLGYEGTDEAAAFTYIVDALSVLSVDDPIALLQTILTYHVAPGTLQASQVVAADSIVTLAQAEIEVSVDSGTVTLEDLDDDLPDPTVIATDILASNGIVHVIDGVLIPADILDGEGTDLEIASSANELIDTGDGTDFVNALGGDDIVRGGAGDDVILGGDGFDRLNGGDGDDVIRGGATEADEIDVIYAGAGDDDVDGGYGNDLIFGMDGNDNLIGHFGADTIAGQDGNDSLHGGAFGDELSGNAGDDFLNGGFGSDRLNGGEGADEFFHLGVADHGHDWIQDYDAAAGDVLVFGITDATADDFQINTAHTSGAGVDDIGEAFVIYVPTEQILWALVDGAAQDSLNVSVSGQVFDILA